MDEDWELVKSFLPKNWRWLAKREKALKGLRKDKDPETLLRALLVHLGCGHSLRETSVRLREAGIADLSDVALLKRLRKSKNWLRALCVSLLRESGKPEKKFKDKEYRLFDSSIIKEQGKTGSLWRLHYSLRIPSLRCDFFRVTPAKGAGNGDSFLGFPVEKGDYVIADRGYCQANGIHYISSKGAYVCVRLNQASINLNGLDGKPFPLLDKLEKKLKRAGVVGEWDVLVPGREGSVAGRICAIRKSAMAIDAAQQRLQRRASKNCTKLKPETPVFAKYIVLLTTFPKSEYPPGDVLDGYRYRWQIELIFKRFKQLAELGHLPKTDPVSAEAWLYGKLLVAILTQKMVDHASFFSPWGYDVEKIEVSESLA